MGRRFVFVSAVLVLCAVVCALPAYAMAETGLARPVPGTVLLRFGAEYGAGSRQVTHRGVDLAAATGERVGAAADGAVTFAGQVPADGGGCMTAVTVRTDSGLLVTVMPLGRAVVRAGDEVSAGDTLGMLDAAGDDSSAAAHVHLSVRKDGVYIDPEPLLASGEAAEAPAQVSGTVPDSAGTACGTAAVPGVTAASRAPSASGAAATGAKAVIGYRASVAPALTPAQAEAIRQAFSAEIGILRAGHGRMRTTGFAEPSTADLIVAAMPPSVAMPSVRIAGGVLLGIGCCGVVAAGLKRRIAVAESAGWRA